MDDVEHNRQRPAIGLCGGCQHARLVDSSRQSTFYLCERSIADASFPKYPRLPVFECRGFVRREAEPS